MTAGRPLRFLLIAIGGWASLRAFALWPVTVPVIPPAQAAVAGDEDRSFVRDGNAGTALAATPAWRPPVGRQAARADHANLAASAPPPPAAVAVAGQVGRHAPVLTIPTIPPPLSPAPLASPPSRWAASAWLIARGGARGSLLGGQLGASQAGARVTYAIDPARRIALAGRIATPLAGRGREVAVGIDWQPLRLPLHLIAEQRFGLDGNRGGPTLEVVGGFGPVDVAPRVQVEGYGQAGGIARGGIEGFADGASRIAYRLLDAGKLRIDAGAGLWGGAQRGAARLDVGPSVGVVAPVGGKAVRMTIDWRQRIAGSASPGSGPALSIGRDF